MKIRSLLLVGAAFSCAGVVNAETPVGSPPNVNGWMSYTSDWSTPNPGGGIAGTTNQIINVDISGKNTWDLVSSAVNEVMLVDLATLAGFAPGTQVTMVSIGWSTNQTAFGASWLSEMRMYFDDNIAPDLSGLFLTPGFQDSFPGSGSYNSGGQIDLSSNAIPNIVLPNGILRLEFHESFDDVAGAIDGTFTSGSVLNIGILEIPGPGALALLGVAGLVGTRRRRN